METQIIVNLLYNIDNRNSKFATKNVKKNVIDIESKGKYSPPNRIKFLTSSLESSLFVIIRIHIFLSKEILLLQVVIIIQN